jgi:hypothetical protein
VRGDVALFVRETGLGATSHRFITRGLQLLSLYDAIYRDQVFSTVAIIWYGIVPVQYAECIVWQLHATTPLHECDIVDLS